MSLQSTCYKIQEIQVHRILDLWGVYMSLQSTWYKIQEIQVHRILDFSGSIYVAAKYMLQNTRNTST